MTPKIRAKAHGIPLFTNAFCERGAYGSRRMRPAERSQLSIERPCLKSKFHSVRADFFDQNEAPGRLLSHACSATGPG